MEKLEHIQKREMQLREIGKLTLVDARTEELLPIQVILGEDEEGRLYLRVGEQIFPLG